MERTLLSQKTSKWGADSARQWSSIPSQYYCRVETLLFLSLVVVIVFYLLNSNLRAALNASVKRKKNLSFLYQGFVSILVCFSLVYFTYY